MARLKAKIKSGLRQIEREVLAMNEHISGCTDMLQVGCSARRVMTMAGCNQKGAKAPWAEPVLNVETMRHERTNCGPFAILGVSGSGLIGIVCH